MISLPRKKRCTRRRRLGIETSEGVDPSDDPATPQLRRAMMRKLIVAAIDRYEEKLAATRWMDAAYPALSKPAPPAIGEDLAERQAWRRLVDQVDADFDNAELGLATLIQSLYDDLAPDDRKAGFGEHGHFVERAVSYRGTTYALQYEVERYEPATCIVATVRDSHRFDLEWEDRVR
jgi:hypothetical protein